ncbi:MAG: hypothetical protein JRF57_16150 [Deltaproteobacteria bacterium]|nr:hypothetical protein [Deltaproteobacteria bacterium]
MRRHFSLFLERDRTTLVFEGRLYGCRDLSSAILTLLERYEREKDGRALFNSLEGDFALFLFDHEEEKALLGTDRFCRGEIYWRPGPPFSFFTHPRAFFQKIGGKPSIYLDAIWDRFAIGAVTPPETPYRNVYGMVSGEYVEIDTRRRGVSRIRYWSPLSCVTSGKIGKIDDEAHFAETLRECFVRKVGEEISSFGKLGVGLSGGMDSAAILGAARRNFGGDIIAVSVAPDGEASPDIPNARTSAAFNGARHLVVFPGARDLEDFPAAMGRLSQPFRSASTYMNYQISKKVAENGGECVLWGYGADLVLGNTGYDRRFYERGGSFFPPPVLDPLLYLLKKAPQRREIVAIYNRLLRFDGPIGYRMAEKYFRAFKKPRYYQEKRLFREEFLNRGREEEILRRIDDAIGAYDEFIIERLMEADIKVVHLYHQVSGTHQICRLNGVDSIITYYNKDYFELILKASNRIRALGGWNKYILRKAFKPLVHEDIYRGKRGACIIRWDRIISGPFRGAVIRYLRNSSIVNEIFKVQYLPKLHRMIKHPGLMYLNLLGLALWYDVNFEGVSPETLLSEILGYSWREQDRRPC